MDWPIVLLIIFGGLAILMAAGLPVAVAFMAVNIVGAAILWQGGVGLQMLVSHMLKSVSNFLFLPIPMFVLMGELLFRSGMAMSAMDAIDKWLGRLPGRLGLIAVAAGTLLSVMTGNTISTTAILGKSLAPEMVKRGYKKPITFGSIMGGAGLAILIPPSSIAVLYAGIAEAPIGDVLVGGAIPGLLLAVIMAIYIIGRCWLQPSLAPAYDVTPTPMSKKLGATVKYVLPLGFIVFMVTGLIIMGVASPSESAALGVASALILAAAYRRLNWNLIKESLRSTLEISAMVFIIIAGATSFGNILAFTGASWGLVSAIQALALSPITIVIIFMLILGIMGMFIGPVPMIMIMTPIFMPVIYSLNLSPVWFGILFLIMINLGTLTPPFGYLLIVMRGVSPVDTTMGEVIRAAVPFVIMNAILVVLVLVFPVIALWLPSIMVR